MTSARIGVLFVLYEANMLIDQGEQVSIETVRQAAQNGALVDFLLSEYGKRITMNISSPDERKAQVNRLFQVQSEAYDGDEGRKLGVFKNGLNLVVVFAAELLYHTKMIDEILSAE